MTQALVIGSLLSKLLLVTGLCYFLYAIRSRLSNATVVVSDPSYGLIQAIEEGSEESDESEESEEIEEDDGNDLVSFDKKVRMKTLEADNISCTPAGGNT